MNSIRFTSILNPEKYGFQFEPDSTSHWEICYRTPNLLSYHSFYFETFGDKCQHTPLTPVASDLIALDWLLSLASHLSEHPEEFGFELNGLFGYSMPSRETAEFLASIKEPKDSDPAIFYSVGQLKISRNPDKRHDKRWFELQREAFRRGYDLDRLAYLWRCGQETRALTKIENLGLYFALADGLNRTVSFSASESLPKFVDEDTLSAARVLRELIRACDATQSARRSIEIVLGNVRRAHAEQTATQKAA